MTLGQEVFCRAVFEELFFDVVSAFKSFLSVGSLSGSALPCSLLEVSFAGSGATLLRSVEPGVRVGVLVLA